jgi:hypothetical protein
MPICIPRDISVFVWFENEAGEHLFTGYIVGNCIPADGPQAVIKRMTKEAVLLRPGEHLDGTYPINTATFDFLKPGTYSLKLCCPVGNRRNSVPRIKLNWSP